MKIRNLIYGMLVAALVGGATFTLASCSSDDDSGNSSGITSIPPDSKATPNPSLPGDANTSIPNLNYTIEKENGQTVIRFDMTGIQDPETMDQWLKLYGTTLANQNVWLEIDKKAKGFTVHNTIDDANQSTAQSLVDLVFLVDNSGSMDEEADVIAADIVDWSKSLAKTLNMRFGCVGYDVEGFVNGALDFNDADSLARYLNREGYNWGTSRTMDFDDTALSEAAYTFSHMYDDKGSVYDENGVMALRFAHEKFSFRPGANRVYVNFTDEPNQPNGNPEWGVEWVKDTKNWATTYGTVHTVFSEDTTYYEGYWTPEYYERPWALSDYTGGTAIFTSNDFENVSLESLPITGALQNSYYLRTTDVNGLFDGKEHTVKITVLSPDKKVRAEREFNVVFTR